MADWPLARDGQRLTSVGVNAAASTGTTIGAAGAANTKTAWVQLTASTPHHADEFIAHLRCDNRDGLFDIAIGPAGSEQVIAANLYAGGKVGRDVYSYRIPLPIPQGTRVAVRAQTHNTAIATQAHLTLIQGGYRNVPAAGRINTYGAATADSGGVSVDPGATINTKGAWSEIVASAVRDHHALLVAFGCQINAGRGTATYLFDIGIGAAGSEVVAIPDLPVHQGAGPAMFPRSPEPIAVGIPAGSRIAARCQASVASVTVDVLAYGVS